MLLFMNKKISFYVLLAFAGISIYSCNNNSNNEKVKTVKDTVKPVSKKEPEKAATTTYERPPIVNIVDTLAPKRTVIYAKDSAAVFEGISLKLANIYGNKLGAYIKKNNLKMTGAPMAWYTKQKPPYFFEAGVPVNKAGTKPVAGVAVREMAAGKAIIAHFYGPFNLLPQGYDAVKEYIKDKKLSTNGMAYEVHLTDPIDKNGKPVDPYKVQTDIVFPVRQ